MWKRTPPAIGSILRGAEKRFKKAKLAFGHGTDNARNEAAFLIAETLGLPHDARLPLDKKLTEAECRAVEAVVGARIAARKPAPYLVNKAYIQGIPFYVDERVIVPRSFIGELLFAEGGFGPPGFPGEIGSVLDLCAGSGCLAILAANVFPDAAIDAADLSADALTVARRNIADHGLGNRIALYEGDLFAPLRDKKYDLIVANPPYVDAAGMNALPPEYRHEPALALASGDDGLDLVRRILAEAPAHLHEKGGLLCEVGRGRKILERDYPALPFLWLDTENSEGEVFWLPRRKMSA